MQDFTSLYTSLSAQVPSGINLLDITPSGVLIFQVDTNQVFTSLNLCLRPTSAPFLYLVPGELQPSGNISYTYQSKVTYQGHPCSYFGVYYLQGTTYHIALTSFDTTLFTELSDTPIDYCVSHHVTSVDFNLDFNISSVDFSLVELPDTNQRLLLPYRIGNPSTGWTYPEAQAILTSNGLSQYRPLSNFIPIFRLQDLFNLVLAISA